MKDAFDGKRPGGGVVLAPVLPEDCPPPLRAALEARGAVIQGIESDSPKIYVFAEGPDGKMFGWYSSDPSAQAMVDFEVEVRRVIGDDGPLRAPTMLDHGALWRLERAVDPEPLRGEKAISAVVAAVAALARITLPTPPGGLGRERIGAKIRRRVRVAHSPLPIADFVRARRVLSRSPLPQVMSHGNLFEGHVLMADGVPWLIDWELAGMRPAGHDLMQLWIGLEGSDRDFLFESCCQMVGESWRAELLSLRYAILVREIAGMLSEHSPENRRQERAAELLELLPPIRAAARSGQR